MADSTSDISKLKVVELKKELKSRGLSVAGDKSELVSRLQTALAKDANSENTIDSDELDSDGVLEDDDDDKNTTDLINEDLINDVSLTTTNDQPSKALDDKPNTTPATRILKRKPPPVITSSEIIHEEDKLLSPDEPSPPKKKISAPDDSSKKISLNRVAITAPSEEPNTEVKETSTSKIVKITMDPKERLELRAKRFGTPLSGDAAKEARKARFGSASSSSNKITEEKAADVDVLKKRAERFGLSVSKTMVDEEYKEKLEKRKARFSGIKA